MLRKSVGSTGDGPDINVSTRVKDLGSQSQIDCDVSNILSRSLQDGSQLDLVEQLLQQDSTKMELAR